MSAPVKSLDLVQKKSDTLQTLLSANKSQIEAALPKHLTSDRLLRIALTEARKNPVLLECTQASFLGAIIQTAQLGLEPGSALGQSWLVPFRNNKLNIMEVQFIVGYRGMIDLAYRSPLVSHAIARAVYEGDHFFYQYGTDEKIEHRPDKEASGKRLTHVYAIVFLKSGGKVFDVMEIKEVEAVRARSKSADSGPWETDYEAMSKKTVVRRLFKFTPVSVELSTAITMDEAAERGEQFNGDVIETTGTRVPEGRGNSVMPDPGGGDGVLEPIGYRIPFGQYRQRSLEEVGADDLLDYVSYLESNAKKKGEALSSDAVAFIMRANEYIASCGKAPVEKEKPKVAPVSRIELGRQINAAAKELKYSGDDVSNHSMNMFKKTTKDLSVEEMQALLADLNTELRNA